ncbi:HAD superfamily hydrolase (TIGR01459 family) [Frondihabitans sp. PhB188]|uniref:HAD-IIA family hydrolase n=1 Tax=Frondihabitans sp. PhB188 TaxID=2485200 RepID=UPI000FA0A8F8|nr:HAD-IIA family hydrolase [Frondihabitans sp. PhB188]ROQ40645.1 HAD superfamily hydrolase (TIGR01459 family) [Frondihabitans sp. PhB188]
MDVVLADLDGVVYTGRNAIPHAVESLNRAAADARVAYITNNASRTADAVAAQLSGFGLDVSGDDVVTSPQAAIRLLVDAVEPGSTILVVGGEGLTTVVQAAGFTVTRSADDSPAAVIQGFAPEVGWKDLAEASFALAADIPWIATNQDWTIPQERGIAPGNGTLVSAVHTAVGRLPLVAGKPERAIFDAALERYAAEAPLFIGDRLDTDIIGANKAGIPSVLVLTGIDKAKQVLAAAADSRPQYILGDLRELHEEYPATVETTSRDGARVFTVRDARVQLHGNVVTVLESGDLPVDLLRAGAAAVWASGLMIYGMVVDPALHA